MDKKIFVLIILIVIVLVATISLIGWQTGFVVKDSDTDGKGSLKLVDQQENNQESVANTDPAIALNTPEPETTSVRRSSGGGSGSSGSGGGTPNPNPNPNPTPPSEKPSVKISITPSTSNYAKGDEFIINVDISTEEKIYAAEFTLTFNSEILKIIEVNEKDFLKQDATSTSLQICKQGFKELCPIINNAEGKVDIANTRIGTTTGVSGQGSLVEIKFKAKNSGTSDLTLSNIKIADTTLEVDKFDIQAVNGKAVIA